MLDKYAYAQRLTPAEKALAIKLRQGLDDDFELAYQNNAINSYVQNYISQLWGESPDAANKAANALRFQARNGAFDTSLNFAKERTFKNAFEGELQGWKLKSDDPTALAANYRFHVLRALAARNFVDRLRATDVRARDARPLAAIAGTGQVLGDHGEDSPAVLVNPDRARSVRIADKVIENMEKTGELASAVENGTVRQIGTRLVKADPKVAQSVREILNSGRTLSDEDMARFEEEDGQILERKPLYAWTTSDYQSIDHPAFRDWIYTSPDTAGNPVFMKGEMRIHPEAAEFIRRAVGAERSPIRDFKIGNVPVGKYALRASGEAKHLLLSLSPFHVVQEGLRAVMTGISPFGKPDFDVRSDPELRFGVEHGLTLPMHRQLEMYTEGVGGHSAIINRVPGLREMQNHLQDFLFDKYIPGLKVRAYRSLFERYRDLNPEWSKEKVATVAAAHANEVFGGINYAQLGRSLSTQDVMRVSMLAPDWLESEMRFLKRAVTPGGEGQIARRDLARIAVLTFAAARVLNLATTGKLHLEAPFGVAIPGQQGQAEKVYSFRTLPVDLMHAISDPRNFIQGRVNPLYVRTGVEAFTGRDQYGRVVTPFKEFGDAVQNVVPIPTQAKVKQLLGYNTELGNIDQLTKAAGASVYEYRTEAEKLAQQYASYNTPNGPVDASQLAKHQMHIRVEDMIRNGQVSGAQVYRMMPRREAQQVMQDAMLTPLQARFIRLPLLQALNVWDVATNSEKSLLFPELLKKRANYLKSHPASERVSDPTNTRLLQVFPQ